MIRRNGTVFIFILLVALSFYAGSKLLTPSFFTSHDGPGHVIRLIDFNESFREGQIPVRIAKRLDNGLGYPFYNFNYPLINYLAEPLLLTGVSAVAAFKTLLFISIFLGAFGMYFFTNEFFGRKPAFIAAVFYTFAPYRFLDVYVRGNVGESLGLSMLPFFLLSIVLIQRKHKFGPLAFVLSLSFLILVHNITAFFGFGLGIALYLVNTFLFKKKPYLKTFALSLLGVLGLTAFFIVPVAIETRLTRLTVLGSDYRTFFPSLKEIIYSPWGFGLWQPGSYPGKMSPQLGVIHETVYLAATALALFFFIRGKGTRAEGIAFLFVLLVAASIFLSLPVSNLIWAKAYLLQVIQMPWRFVGYATLGCSFLGAYLVSRIKRYQLPAMSLLLILVLYANRNHIAVNQYVPFTNPFNKNGVYWHSTAAYAEHTPKDAPLVPTEPDHNGDIVFASGSAKRMVWRSNYQMFAVSVDNNAYFRNNVYYFPGWIAKVDGKQAAIEHANDPLKRLYVRVPKGSHAVEFFFTETWYRKAADLISAGTFFAGCVYLYFLFRQTGRQHSP